MEAVVLLGGQGTRIRSLHPDRPKALVPVAGRPFLRWQLEWLQQNGVSTVHLAAGYMGDSIRDWVDEAIADMDVSVTIEPEPLGTAGAVRYLADRVQEDAFLVVNGDTLVLDLDLHALQQTHLSHSGTATIAVAHVARSGRYGTVEAGQDGLVRAFTEKADRDDGWVNAGVYAFRREVLELIPPARKVSMEEETFPLLVCQGALFVHRTESALHDMGTPDGLKALEARLRRNVAQTEIPRLRSG